MSWLLGGKGKKTQKSKTFLKSVEGVSHWEWGNK
jgi:hypothetical protein